MATDFPGFREFEQGAWSRQGKAAEYRDHFAPLTRPFADHLVRVLGIGPGTRVLDLGSGSGVFSAAAAATGAEVTGLDFSPEMVATASAEHPGIRFLVGDAEEPALEEGTGDAIMAGFVLQHLARPELALRAWHRLLAPGGRVGLCNWVFEARPTPSPQTVFRQALGDAGVVPAVALPDGPDLMRYDSRETMRGLLERAGFTGVEHEELAIPSHLSADQIWDAMVKGSVRMAALMEGQGDLVRERVREALRERVAGERSITLNASVASAGV